MINDTYAQSAAKVEGWASRDAVSVNQAQRTLRNQIASLESLAQELRERVERMAVVVFGPQLESLLSGESNCAEQDEVSPLSSELERVERILRQALNAATRLERLG